jgi:predicted nucleic acid-binding protein
MSLVIDASVMVKLVAEEPGSAAARATFVAEPSLVAPDLIRFEVFSALWKKCRLGIYQRDQVGLALSFLDDCVETVPTEQLFLRASQLSFELNHPIYDCAYLALAERKSAVLATADGKLATAGRRIGTMEIRQI